jgi:4-amino-4-deoxy-L-arabinose transferase-like glycosyltransferase
LGRRPALHPPRPGLETGLVLALVLAYLAVMLPSLTRFPPLNNDEGREGNLSWVASGLQPGAERMNAYRGFGTWGTGGLQGATTVALFRLFGLGLFQARLTSLLWGGLLLLVVYWLGRYYWGRAVGLAAMALLAVSDPFLLSTHTLRPDIQVVTLVLLALALVEHGLTSGRAWPPVVAGLLLGLSFDTHMNTLAFMPLVAAAPLVRYGWSVWRRPTIWLLAAGLGLAALYYIGVRILPDPSGYVAAFGPEVRTWARVVAARGPRSSLLVVLAPLGDAWRVLGTTPAP